jgi:predicted RNA-binding protein
MRQRVAKKILKYRDKLNYTEEQVKRAEKTLEEAEQRKTKQKSGENPE